jgi:hypothetical protein
MSAGSPICLPEDHGARIPASRKGCVREGWEEGLHVVV